MERYFECNKENFWSIMVRGHCVTINYGLVGTVGKETIHCYESDEKAKKLALKFMENKLKKGYVELQIQKSDRIFNKNNNITSEKVFPEILKKLHRIELDFSEGEGIDFEPFEEFLSFEDTTDWIKTWTGNNSLDGSDYLIFGQDGTGGYVAIWCLSDINDLLKQPIVFFSSEGEAGVIAKNLCEYVWLFAGGFGPYEAIAYPNEKREELPIFLEFAEKNCCLCRYEPKEIFSRAKREYPDFEKYIDELCN